MTSKKLECFEEWLGQNIKFSEIKTLSPDSERRYWLEKMRQEKPGKPISKTQLRKLNNSEKRNATAYSPFKPLIYRPKKEMDWLEFEQTNNNPLKK